MQVFSDGVKPYVTPTVRSEGEEESEGLKGSASEIDREREREGEGGREEEGNSRRLSAVNRRGNRARSILRDSVGEKKAASKRSLGRLTL